MVSASLEDAAPLDTEYTFDKAKPWTHLKQNKIVQDIQRISKTVLEMGQT